MEQVTVIEEPGLHAVGYTLHWYVLRELPEGVLVTSSPTASARAAERVLPYADQGLTWIRGAHELDSPELVALLAASALRSLVSVSP